MFFIAIQFLRNIGELISWYPRLRNPGVFFLQIDLRPDPMEAYPGPSQPVDFVLMSHVCYYFRDSFPMQIKRALQWLQPWGCLVLVHQEVDKFRKELRELFLITCDYILSLNSSRYFKKIKKSPWYSFLFCNILLSLSENVMKNSIPRYTIADTLNMMAIPYKGGQLLFNSDLPVILFFILKMLRSLLSQSCLSNQWISSGCGGGRGDNRHDKSLI